MKNHGQVWIIGLTAAMTCALAGAQQMNLGLPSITSAEVPLYPSIARVANVEGVVHVKVTTDGHHVTAVHAEDGQKVLAAAADKNAQTWQFPVHEPTTLTVTYRYKLVTNLNPNQNNARVILRLPTEIEVEALRRRPINDPPAELGYFNPTLCELVANAGKYVGKPIKVRAVLVSGMESAILRDETCQPVPASGKQVLATFSGSNSPESGLAKRLARLPKTKQQARVTVVGEFDDIGHTIGHQGCCRYKLEIQQVLAADEVKP